MNSFDPHLAHFVNLGRFAHVPCRTSDCSYTVYGQNSGSAVCTVHGVSNHIVTEFDAFFITSALNRRFHDLPPHHLIEDPMRRFEWNRFLTDFPNGPQFVECDHTGASGDKHEGSAIYIATKPHLPLSEQAFELIQHSATDLYHELVKELAQKTH